MIEEIAGKKKEIGRFLRNLGLSNAEPPVYAGGKARFGSVPA